jgi:FkbM family methyltransferase
MIFYEPFDVDAFFAFAGVSGDSTLRIDYKLDNNSTVIDAGGYVGQWAYDINAKYDSTVYVFEPVKHSYDGIVAKFEQTPKVLVFNYGLSDKTQELQISIEGDSSSVYNQEHSELETILCRDFDEVLKEQNITHIDLMKINIEGGEYDLLDHIIKKKLQSNIDNFQIQYHRFVPDCAARRDKISEALSKTHTRTWNYEWIWENWEIKK